MSDSNIATPSAPLGGFDPLESLDVRERRARMWVRGWVRGPWLRRWRRSTRRLPRRWPTAVFLFGGVLACGLGLLFAVAWLSGSEARTRSNDPVDAFLVALQRPAVAVIAACAALAAIAWAGGRIWLERLARRPGPIHVNELIIPEGLTGLDATKLSMNFRHRLSRLRLRSPGPMPFATPAGNFLGVLSASGVDSRNILGSVISVLRAAIPTHAYDVTAALVVRAEPPRYGVTVEVVRLPHDAIPATTLWARTPEEVIELGADAVTATILPRTRLCRSPWSGWRRYAMPPGLLHDYEHAAWLTEQRRYDEAMHLYYRALEQDPMNVDLRLQIGFVQERLGLFLDAFAMYVSAFFVARRSHRRLYDRRARREREASSRIAHYRMCAVLAGRHLAAQWRRPAMSPIRAPTSATSGPPEETDRDRQREQLRERLEPVLLQLLRRRNLVSTTRRPDATPPRWSPEDVHALLSLQAVPGDKRDPEEEASQPPRDYYELRELFAWLAAKEIKRLRRRVRFRRLYPEWPRLTFAAVRLGVGLVEARRDFVMGALGRRGAKDEWRNPRYLEARVREVAGPAGLQFWSEHYNAACVYAIPLLAEPRPGENHERRRLAQRAVRHLRQAVRAADSTVLAGQRNWLLSEDPDLDALRRETDFKQFEVSFFPSPTPTPTRPKAVKRWEITRYTGLLVAETAKRWEQEWHRRASALTRPLDPHELLEWWHDEFEAWELVRRVAFHRRHWGARLALIDQMRVWSMSRGFEPLDVGVPEYEGSLATANEDADERATEAITRLNERMDRLAELLREAATEGKAQRSLLSDVRDVQGELRACDDEALKLGTRLMAQLCDAHAALWQRLREWLDNDDDDGRKFSEALARTARDWRRARLYWGLRRRVHTYTQHPGVLRPNHHVDANGDQRNGRVRFAWRVTWRHDSSRAPDPAG